MNAHTIQISERDYQTTLHSCGCPDFTRRGGGYMFYNFLTGDTLVGCKHMHQLYINQAKAFVAQSQFLKDENDRLNNRIKKAVIDRIDAEQRLEDALADNRILTRKLNAQLEGMGV